MKPPSNTLLFDRGSLVLLTAAQLRFIKENSKARSLRMVSEEIVKKFVGDFNEYGLDPIRLGLLVIAFEAKLIHSGFFRSIYMAALKQINVWNIRKQVLHNLHEVQTISVDGVDPNMLRCMKFSDGRHQFAAVQKFILENGVLTPEEFDQTYVQVQFVPDCTENEARIISLQRSRTVLVTTPGITDVMNCMPHPGVGLAKLKSYIKDEATARKLMLPDSESVRRALSLSFGLYPSSKALMKLFRCTNLFSTSILLRKNHGFYQLVVSTTPLPLVLSRYSAVLSKLHKASLTLKERCQLVLIAFAISICMFGINANENELLGRFSKCFLEAVPSGLEFEHISEIEEETIALSSMHFCLKDTFKRFLAQSHVPHVIEKAKKVIRAFPMSSNLFHENDLWSEKVLTKELPRLESTETRNMESSEFAANMGESKQVTDSHGAYTLVNVEANTFPSSTIGLEHAKHREMVEETLDTTSKAEFHSDNGGMQTSSFEITKICGSETEAQQGAVPCENEVKEGEGKSLDHINQSVLNVMAEAMQSEPLKCTSQFEEEAAPDADVTADNISILQKLQPAKMVREPHGTVIHKLKEKNDSPPSREQPSGKSDGLVFQDKEKDSTPLSRKEAPHNSQSEDRVTRNIKPRVKQRRSSARKKRKEDLNCKSEAGRTTRSPFDIKRKKGKQGTVQTNGVEANSRKRKFKEVRQDAETGENMRRISPLDRKLKYFD
ncbi:hypothetical protein BWQ96_05972 [Gracilariopsis chorda]|uniref:Uncharacterized protein n=1 Tax=Gracilariopsis chorda TaxID=448386 RepID=A0A2V3IQB0_9FLOR|nr:hypothetical protein BWQ96_05972 [Gracilariopsis chorda]|eukprot:PXF44268.1 hypothetical protein BWQ96_05972 [Gracilariopsis chorda]